MSAMCHRRCCDVTLVRPTLTTVIAKHADDSRPGKGSGTHVAGKDGLPSLEAGLLAELRAALAEHEISSEVRRDLACLAVKGAASSCCIWVFVGFGGRYFSWDNAEYQHPVRDMSGAAHRIATHVHSASVPNAEDNI
jgi:hypothetical protein